VVRESANLWAELVVKKVDSYEDLRAFLVRAEMVADGDPLAIDKTEVRGTEESRLRRLLEEAGGRTAPLPMVEHDAVVERALRREQPFESKGRDGYRDVILWETLLAMAAEDGPIVFISNDHRAFFDRDSSKGLSGKLRDEFQSRAVEGATIDLFSEVGPGTDTALEKAAAEVERKAAIAAQEQANAETLERLNALVAEDMGFAAKLAAAVEEALGSWELGEDLRGYGIADSDVYSTYVDVVESVGHLDFRGAYRLEAGGVLADLVADVVVSATLTLESRNAMLLDEHPQVRMRDLGLLSGVAEGSAELAARVRFEVVVDPDIPDLLSVATVEEVEPLSAGEYLSAQRDRAA
jgi:hypothetical protein